MSVNKQALVDINEATEAELATISGIGHSLANKIIENRPFKRLKELVNIPGISETKLSLLTPYLTIEQPISKAHRSEKKSPKLESAGVIPVTKLGNTEAFVFLEDRNERQDALLMIFGGFILGLILLFIRQSNQQ